MGHPFLYWADRGRYVLVSAGANGILDREWSEAALPAVGSGGENDDPKAELVFVDGAFGQWPRVDRP